MKPSPSRVASRYAAEKDWAAVLVVDIFSSKKDREWWDDMAPKRFSGFNVKRPVKTIKRRTKGVTQVRLIYVSEPLDEVDSGIRISERQYYLDMYRGDGTVISGAVMNGEKNWVLKWAERQPFQKPDPYGLKMRNKRNAK